ncbi:MAG: TetR family transcriptional regulator [Candidatus Acidiferrales bacterium]
MRRGRRKAQHPETARRILEAAARHFAAHGLAGARTDEIAAAAHANKAMLYYYFGDKRRLHRAVLENIFRQAMNAVDKTLPETASPREQLLAFVHGNFEFRAAHPHYTQLFLRMMTESRDEIRWLARNYLRSGHRHLRRVIEQGIARGEFRRVDPVQTVITIIGMVAFYFASGVVHTEILKRDALSPHAVAAHKRAVLDFLEHGLFHPEMRNR